MLKGMSVNGSWSRAQLAALGLSPNKRGWKYRAIGTLEVTEKQVSDFLDLKDTHLKKHHKLNTYQQFLKRAITFIDDNSFYEETSGGLVIDSLAILEYLQAYVEEKETERG